jgi:hypothetical protein
MQRASSQSTHHLVAGEFSSILVHGSQLVFNDIPDALCIHCVKAHKGSRVSMTHHVIDIEIISTLPGEVLTTQEKCSRHPDWQTEFRNEENDL